MGEEHGETAPFPYFISHSEPDYIELVRRGRQAEFDEFAWQGVASDPLDETTFHQAKLQHALQTQGYHQTLWEFYQKLIRLRKSVPALVILSKDELEVVRCEKPPVLFLRRWCDQGQVAAVFNFGSDSTSLIMSLPSGSWHKLLDSSEVRWSGPGNNAPPVLLSPGTVAFTLPAHSFILLERTGIQ